MPSLAINTVHSLFKKYNNIEDIMKLNKYNFANEYNSENLTIVRNIFSNFNYEIPNILEKRQLNKIQFENYLQSYNIKNNYKI